jgi:hypothetical protein
MKKHNIFFALVVCCFLFLLFNPAEVLFGNSGEKGILQTGDRTARDRLLEAQAYQGKIKSGLANLEQVVKLYEAIIEKYPNSKYELESHYGIAMAVSEDRDPNIVTESDYELARKHYQEIIRKWPDVTTEYTIYARFHAYDRTPEFERSLIELYKWLTTLTMKQKIDSTWNYAFPTEEIPKDINKSFLDNYTEGIVDTNIKMLEDTVSLTDGEMPFGQDVNGLRCRWVRPNITVKIDDKVKMIVEVENCSSDVISWYCSSQQTLGVLKSSSKTQTMYAFDIEKGDGVESVGNIYKMQPGSRIKLVCKSPWKIENVGINKLSCTIYRYNKSSSIGYGYAEYELLHCLPLAYMVEYKTVSEIVRGLDVWLLANK